MTISNVDNFLELVRRSGLVERDQLNRVLVQLKERAGDKPITEVDLVGNQLVKAGLLTRWQYTNLREGKHKGFFLGKYKLLDRLGSGGMSTVYLAEHVLMQRRVAIKVLPTKRVEDSSYLARFHREAQAAASVDHRNIVRAYDVDNDENVHYLVMEYVEGRDLQLMVKEDGPLDYPVTADYIRQAAEGLAHAHEAGLIHRDVKPANLLVTRNGVVKVLDLGLARFTDDKRASLTVAYDENVLGTADYLAPEQALNSHAVDGRVDIYSLGCTLYFLLTGHPPFCEGTLPQRLMMHQKHPPPSIYDDRPDAPEDLVAICLRMMAKKPESRYQSAAEVAEVLGNWLLTHGYTFDMSGSSSGSSSQLTAAVAGSRRLAMGRDIAELKLRQSGSSGKLLPQLPGAGGRDSRLGMGSSGKLAAGNDTYRFIPAPSEASGTDDGDEYQVMEDPSGKSPGGDPRRSKSEPADRQPTDGDTYPLKPDAPDPRGGKKAGSSASRAFTDGHSNPTVAGLPMAERFGDGGEPGTAAPGTPGLPKAKRLTRRQRLVAFIKRGAEVPFWVWVVVVGGCVLAVLVLMFLLTQPT